MHLRLTFEIPFLAMTRDTPVDFAVKRANATVRFEKPDGQKPGVDGWRCISFCQREPKQAVKEIFEGLNQGSIDPAKDWQAYERRGLELLGPPAYRAFVDNTQRELAEIASQCAAVIQWRLGLRGSHQPLRRGERLWWSLNGDDWHPIMGVSGSAASQFFSATLMNERSEAAVLDLLEADEVEPLGHELLREAIELCRTGGQRSAFVVAIMAAEVGVKQCIAELLPQTEWLMANPTPPLMKLIQEQLPLVEAKYTIKGKVEPPPPDVCETLRKGVQMRNDLVHKGKHEKVGEKLRELIDAVRQLLYLLDYYRGHKWALMFAGMDRDRIASSDS